jgi:adenylate cyclase
MLLLLIHKYLRQISCLSCSLRFASCRDSGQLMQARSQSNNTREKPNESQHPPLAGYSEMPPTDQRKVSGLGSHRKVLAAVDYLTPSVSQFASTSSHNPYSANSGSQDRVVPWASSPSLYLSAFLNDSSEPEGSPISPAYRPGTSRTVASDAPDSGYDADHRRPSVASATTVSSQGSKSSHSGRFRKRLQGFFGDEYPDGLESRQDFDASYHHRGSRDNSTARGSNNSISSRNFADRSTESAPSPIPSRPHTPLPSSDVTPWIYQSFNVSCLA